MLQAARVKKYSFNFLSMVVNMIGGGRITHSEVSHQLNQQGFRRIDGKSFTAGNVKALVHAHKKETSFRYSPEFKQQCKRGVPTSW